MKNKASKPKRIRSVTIFALVETLIVILFVGLATANLVFTNETANRRTRQLVEDSYDGLIEALVNDIKSVSRAGFSLMQDETVVRLKSYYYDKIQSDSYARNEAINKTME